MAPPARERWPLAGSAGGVHAERGTTPPLADAPCTGRRPARADRRSAFQAVPALSRGWRYAVSPRCAGRCRSEGPHRENWRRSLASALSGLPASRRDCILTANRVSLRERKRGDGLEPPPGELGRPPAGIARERETSADDAAPSQREFTTLSQSRMARLLTAPPSRALSAGRLAPTGRTGGLGAHPGSTTGC